jgi:hypothetical protein
MAAKKKAASPTRKASPKKSPSKAPKKLIDLSMYDAFQIDCINKAEAIVKDLKEKSKNGEFKHVGHLVATAYEMASKNYVECAPFYMEEKARKIALKAERKASMPARRRRRSRGSRKSPKKCSPSKQSAGCGESWKCGDSWKCGGSWKL